MLIYSNYLYIWSLMAKNTLRWLLFIILYFSLAPKGSGQVDEKKLVRFTVDNGLSQNMIQAICEDRQGFMWFGTKDGLNRYDGYGFKIYRSEAGNPLSLNDDNISAIYEDKGGNLWIGTNSGGLNYFDRASGHFYNLPEISNPDSLPENRHITSITSDLNGDVWVCTRFSVFSIRIKNGNGELLPTDKGIKGLYTVSSYFRILKEGSHLLPNKALLVTKDGYIYNACGTGIYKSGKKISRNNDPVFTRINKVDGIDGILEDASGKIWFISFVKGIFCYDPPKNIFSSYYNDKRLKAPTYYNPAIDMDGNIWFSVMDRKDGPFGNKFFINCFNTKTRVFGSMSPIPDVISNVMYFSSRDVMWIGTPGSGLVKYNMRSNRFHSQPLNYQQVLQKNHLKLVNIFYPDWSFLLVRSANERSVKLFNWVTETFYPVSKTTELIGHGKLPALKAIHTECLEIFARKNGQMWRMNNNTLALECIDSNEKIIKAVKTRRKLRMFSYEDENNNFWVTAKNGWLYRLNKKENGLDSFNYYTGNNLLAIPSEYLIDKDGTCWMGTTCGVLKCDLNSEKCIVVTIPGQAEPLNILSLMNDPVSPDKFLWAGTEGGGLLRINKTSPGITSYHEKDGLPNEVVYGILSDRNHKIWISTNNGIAIFDPVKNNFNTLKKEDGLQSNEFNRFTSFYSSDGIMMFGGINGTNYFTPESIIADTSSPVIAFTGFKLFNRAILPGTDKSPLKNSIELTKNISLTWDQNTISFDFAAFDFNAPQRILYSWKMEGVDKDWTTAGKEHSATYANLSPGKYAFMVRASNSAGYWTREGKSIIIFISPPWWRTWWAYTLYAIIIIAAVYGFFRFRMNRLRLHDALQQEKMEALRLQELDEVKTRFFSNITHEFRTPLTLILGPAEQLLKKTQDKETHTELSRIERNAKQLLKLINQLLDLNKLEAHSMKMEIYSVEVIALIHYIVDTFKTDAAQKSITLTLHTDIEYLHIFSDTDKLQKIISNLLSNALKFTPSGGTVDVFVESIAGENENFLRIKVRDTGIGISAEQQQKVFGRFYQADSSQTRRGEGTGIGLALVKELVELFGGRLSLKSELGKGSEFSVELPYEIMRNTEREITSGIKSKTNFSSAADLNNAPEEIEDDTNEKPRVLIIEDNDDMRSYIRNCLRQQYEVLESADGAQGIENALATIPDLIVSDIMMPEKDGYEVTQTLKQDERTSHIPVILLTAKTAVDSRIKGLQTKADVYLSKPFNADELLLNIKNLISVREQLRKKYSAELTNIITLENKNAEDSFIIKLRGIIENHIEETDFSVEQLAFEANMSRVQLHRKITALTGNSTSYLIRRIRLEKAMELLTLGELSISEIAYSVGFNTPNYFSKCFHEYYGFTPRNAGVEKG